MQAVADILRALDLVGKSQPCNHRSVADPEELLLLERRLGSEYAGQRLTIESAHEARIHGRNLSFARLESSLTPLMIELALKTSGLFWRGRRNAECVQVRHNHVSSENLPPAFDGFVILHLSDLHCDISPRAMRRMSELLGSLSYDICVLTGDYRGATFGPDDAVLAAIADLRPRLRGQVYGVLGNHDPTRMLLGLERLHIRMLMNESEIIDRDGQHIHLAGIDDCPLLSHPQH
jgi:uncharacterized protein